MVSEHLDAAELRAEENGRRVCAASSRAALTAGAPGRCRSAATGERNAATQPALNTADMTPGEGAVASREPRSQCRARRRGEPRARERAAVGSGVDGISFTVPPGRYPIYRPGLEYFEPLDREAAVTIRSAEVGTRQRCWAKRRPSYLSG